MENTVAPTNESTDKPMTHDDIRAAFEDVSLYVERIITLVCSAIELSEQKDLPYGLMAESMNILNELARESDKYQRQIKKGIAGVIHG
ncbi:hypothetical protein [Nitrosomonas sp. Is37]|uniref:hypothetical protein n=1 Tax=Nitrosomonas sp. Is37 TaxID=3080535 RepID=UPI00294B05D7|nr:hypothetical protein [Nitrosomonas sp. Is37]MDV6345634.1 hypothetical protein [Nitrosomonas sp. Is37]